MGKSRIRAHNLIVEILKNMGEKGKDFRCPGRIR